MGIGETLKEALVKAMKERDTLRVETIRFLNAAIKRQEIDRKRQALGDQDIIGVISSLCKQRRDSIEQFKKGGRDDLVAKEEKELAILLSFLPPQLSAEAVKPTVQKLIEKLGAQGPQDMGKVMKSVMQELAGKADGSVISTIVKELLAQR